MLSLYRVGIALVLVSISACHAEGLGFAMRPGNTKDHHKTVQTASLLGTQALGPAYVALASRQN